MNIFFEATHKRIVGGLWVVRKKVPCQIHSFDVVLGTKIADSEKVDALRRVDAVSIQ